MAQKKLSSKQGIQPIFIYPKSAVAICEDKKKVDFLALFFLFACLKIFCEKTTEGIGVTTTVRCRLRRIFRLLPRR